MSRFVSWYVSEHLSSMGWPKSRGVFWKEPYVDTHLLDVVVEQAIQVSVGLGAGKPQLGVAMLVDTFGNNFRDRWSTDELLRILKKGEHEIESYPELLPWKALYAKHRLTLVTLYANNTPWLLLDDAVFQRVWAMTSAWGIFWGLTHGEDMPGVFTKAKVAYEAAAAEAIPHGLSVSPEFPWKSLDNFYDTCQNLVRTFESVRPPLPKEIPPALRAAPEIDRRLSMQSPFPSSPSRKPRSRPMR